MGPQMLYGCMTGDPNFTCSAENQRRADEMTRHIGNLTTLTNQIQSIKSRIRDQGIERSIQREEQEIETRKSETAEKIEKLKEKFDSIKTITEVHEWVVRESEVVPTYFGFEIEEKSDTRKLNQSRNPGQYVFWLNRIINVRDYDYIKPIADLL
ncbi:hypothetical protein [Castellaniella defragrans]|uniref:hypothetical protein n=1 Tax=Castellaniella defragrans TaxID=75697 RepID=UPI002AFDD767|nr:hypothetical protein [Castellaniella defragrans]